MLLLQNRQETVLTLTLYVEQFKLDSALRFLGNLIIADGGVGEITSRITERKAPFANLRHLRFRHDIRPPLKGRV